MLLFEVGITIVSIKKENQCTVYHLFHHAASDDLSKKPFHLHVGQLESGPPVAEAPHGNKAGKSGQGGTTRDQQDPCAAKVTILLIAHRHSTSHSPLQDHSPYFPYSTPAAVSAR